MTRMAGITPSRRGICLVLASAPGGGKTSVSRALLETEPELSLSISATTRAPRPGEEEGVHYYFRSPAQFAAGAAAGETDAGETERDRRLATAVDAIRTRFGGDALRGR